MSNSIKARKLKWDSIPLIDLEPWFKGSEADRIKVAEDVIIACSSSGFLYIKNHQIPQSSINDVFEVAAKFFDLPVSQKNQVSFEMANKNRGYIPFGVESSDPTAKWDEKEAYDFTHIIPSGAVSGPVSERVAGKNLWADAPAELRPIIEKYMAEIMALGKNMFQIFALGLGLKPDYFDDKITFPIAQLRLLHYPAQDSVNTSETNLGIGKHCDYECLTILAQDNMGGLQIENLEGNWIEAPSIEGAYVINIGEMLTRWTNGLFKATPHRVVNIKGGSRYSIPFFFATNYDTNIKPLDVCITENNPVQFEAIKAGDYLLSRLKKIYG